MIVGSTKPLTWLPALLLTIAIGVLFVTSPHQGDFWWSDAPRHAIDGAFYRDLFRDLPLDHLSGYATDYYLQYPALTILFYPPLVPLVEAAFYAVFGVSHFAAQLTIAFFYLVAAWAAYRLCRRWFDMWSAFSVSLLFISLPEVAFWGRQVMLEVPVCALILISCNVLLAYLDSGKAGLLYLLATVMAASVYTKQTALFIFPVFAFAFWIHRRHAHFRDARVWMALGLLGLELLPLAIVSLRFGHVNIDSVTGSHWNHTPVFSWNSWTFYASRLPEQLTWPTLILAVVFIALSFRKRDLWSEANLFLAAWFVGGYLFFSLIALKETRHTVLILFPLAVFAIEGLRLILSQRILPWALIAFASIAFAWTVAERAVPYVSGYRQVVDYLAASAPRNSIILFSGNRDGSFIFDVRSRADRPDLSVLRADKLLMKVAVKRELGVEEKLLTESDISGLLEAYGVMYVVNQPNFWDDLEVMRRFNRVLRNSQFKLVARIPVKGNVDVSDRELDVYQITRAPNPHPTRIQLAVPMAGMLLEGEVGGRASRR